jgi:hypothetical protein
MDMANAKFDIKTEAARPLYAGVGVTDLAVARVRGYVTEVQKRFADLDLEPQALREQARTLVNARVEALAKDATARRAAVEARVTELQGEAKGLPTRVQAVLTDNVALVNTAYADLAKRGETLVARIRRQQSTQEAVSATETAVQKAKTTQTQARKAAKTTAETTKSTAKKAVKKSTTTAKGASATPKSSAKATTTAAKTAAADAAKAATDAAKKIGD